MAYGVLEDKFKEGSRIKDALPIVIKAVSSAMKRNAGTGDSFNVAVIDEKGYRELTAEEKKNF